MRTEMKIALGLFAVNTTLGHLISIPEFLRGVLFGLSLVFMIVGMLPEKVYSGLKARQAVKICYLKRMLRI